MAESSRLDELRRRVQQDPASIAFAALAEEYRRARRYRDAVDTSRAGLRHHPGYISARLTLGRSLIEMHDYEPAERELAVVLRSAPDNLAARRAMGELCWQQLRFADALHHYRTALALVPRDSELPAIVHALEQELEAEEAARVAEQAAESDSPSTEPYESLSDEAHGGESEGEPVGTFGLVPQDAATHVSGEDAAPAEAAQVEVPEVEAAVVETSEVAEPAPDAPLEDLDASVEFTLADEPCLEEELIAAGVAPAEETIASGVEASEIASEQSEPTPIESDPIQVDPIQVESIQVEASQTGSIPVEPILADPALFESVPDAPADFLFASTESEPLSARMGTLDPLAFDAEQPLSGPATFETAPATFETAPVSAETAVACSETGPACFETPATFEPVTTADMAQVLVEARGLVALERLHASLRHEQARREEARAPRRAMTA